MIYVPDCNSLVQALRIHLPGESVDTLMSIVECLLVEWFVNDMDLVSESQQHLESWFNPSLLFHLRTTVQDDTLSALDEKNRFRKIPWYSITHHQNSFMIQFPDN